MGVVVVVVNDEQRDDELWCLDPGNFDVRKNKLVWQHRGTLALFQPFKWKERCLSQKLGWKVQVCCCVPEMIKMYKSKTFQTPYVHPGPSTRTLAVRAHCRVLIFIHVELVTRGLRLYYLFAKFTERQWRYQCNRCVFRPMDSYWTTENRSKSCV